MPTLKYQDPPGSGTWKYLLAGPVGDADTGWIDMVLGNGWTNYGSTWETGQYRKTNGIVYLKGLIKPGTTTVGTVITTLPAGFRPVDDAHIDVGHSTGTAAVCRLNIMRNGDVKINAADASSWWSLAAISFPVAEAVPASMISAGTGPQASDAIPRDVQDGYAAAGVASQFSRADHVHGLTQDLIVAKCYRNVSGTSGATGNIFIGDFATPGFTVGDIATSAAGIVVNHAGYYEVHAFARFYLSSGTNVQAQLLIGNQASSVLAIGYAMIAATSHNVTAYCNSLAYWNAGDTIKLGWNQAVASQINMGGGNGISQLTAKLLYG